MWVPLEKKKKQNQNIKGEMGKDVRVTEKRKEFFSFCFYFILRFFSQIQGKPSVRIRRDKHGKCSTRRGLRVSTRNTRFHREFR